MGFKEEGVIGCVKCCRQFMDKKDEEWTIGFSY